MKVAPAQPPSIVESEISRLTNLGFNTPNPERRKRKVPGLEKTHLVTPEEYKVFTETNQRAASTLERIMSAPSWRTIDEETKVKIINHIYNRYRRGSGKRVRGMMRRRLNS